VSRPLAGTRIVTTRPSAGDLEQRLVELGAVVVHVPLIAIEPPVDGGAALRVAVDGLRAGDWVAVTSRPGAEAVGPLLVDRPVSTAAVGAATAEVLERTTGRPVDVVASAQRAAVLGDELPVGAGRVLVAQADIADGTLVEVLRRRGAEVDTVVAYRTVVRAPSPSERAAVAGADAVVLASGSAARSWVAAELASPVVVVAIGPTTAAAAAAAGLTVTATAAEHSVAGLVAEVVAVLGGSA
jgi:uroporphyrinogen-III synthase